MTQASTESEVGFLHKLVTELWKRRLVRMIDLMDNPDDPENPVKPEFAIDEKVLRSAQKWVTDNGVTATPDADAGLGELASRVQKIREKSEHVIVDFKKEARERGKG